MIEHIYLNISDTLTDAVGGTMLLHGLSDRMRSRVTDYSDIASVTAEAGGPDTDADFWRPAGRAFYECAPWLPHGRVLMSLCARQGVPLTLVDQIATGDRFEGIGLWVDRLSSQHSAGRQRFKTLQNGDASECSVLVADKSWLLHRWERAGGIGILVPAPWNNLGEQSAGYVLSHVGAALRHLR